MRRSFVSGYTAIRQDSANIYLLYTLYPEDLLILIPIGERNISA